ncbi:MAG: hypothetical protein AAFR71_05635 [Pseudomonadota bacterium]
MAYQWITIDEALAEFHATAEKIIKLVEDEVIDRGPDRVVGERKLMQVSLSQLNDHFQQKDTASR